MVNLLYFLSYYIYENKQAVRLLKSGVSKSFAGPIGPIYDAALYDGSIVTKLSQENMWWS
jgi:hypothetical protein